MRKTLRISGLLGALLLASGVEAAGLGRLSVLSALGQPLRAEIELVAVQRDELGSISARLASAEAFRQARMERAEILNSLRFEVEQKPNGQPVVRITSSAPVTDPYLDLLVELNWATGRLIREYTLLLDPPADTRAKVEAPAAQPAVTALPSRQEAAPVPPEAAAAHPRRYGPVKAGETLHAIASRTKAADVTVDQMMVGIFHNNRGAFLDNNMNRLKRGAVLLLPDRDTAMLVDPARASREVQKHRQAWHAYRARLAEATAQPAAAGGEATAGRVTPGGEAGTAPPAAPAQDVLKLSRGEPGAAKALERIQSLEEELAAKARALQEAQERVAQLERTVRDMQRLLELKSAEAPAAPAPDAPAPTPAAPETAPSAAPAPAAQPPAPEKPKAVQAPLPVPEERESWLATFISNPLYVGGLVAAVLLSVLLWMMMVGTRRRRGLTNFEDSIMTGGEFKNEAVFTAGTGVAGTPTGGSALMTDFSRLGLGAIDTHEVDPIAEAEVYMAYGRDAQAEEILKEALAKDPNRHEIALKLLEIYAARKDTVAFEAQASELYASLGGQPTEVWLKAAELGRSIDPDNPLYRVQPNLAAAAAGTAVAAATAAAAASAGMAAETAVPEALTAGDQTVAEPAAQEQDLGPLDFEFTPTAQAETVGATEQVGFAGEEGGEAQATLAPAAELAGLEGMTLEPLEPPQSETPITPEYDLNLEVAEVEALPAAPGVPEITVEEAAGGVMEMPFETAEPQAAAEAEAPQAVPELELALSGIDLELKLPQEPEAPAPEPLAAPAAPEEVAPPVGEAPAGPGQEIDPELWEENNTKLDLARAYLEMGDHEGAREILQEVLADGDSQQKAKAEELLHEVA